MSSSSYLTDGVVDGYTPLILVTTGDIPNFGGDGNFVRQEFDSNGDCIFYGRTAGVLNSFLIRHQGGARSYGTIIFDGLDNVEAIQTFNMGWSGAGAGSMLNLTNGGSRIAWNTSGLMYGIHLDINNVASGARVVCNAHRRRARILRHDERQRRPARAGAHGDEHAERRLHARQRSRRRQAAILLTSALDRHAPGDLHNA